MSKNIFKSLKVFDCQDMPTEVREMFFETCGSPSFRGGNDCLVSAHVYNERKPISGPEFPYKDSPTYKFKYSEYKGGEIIYDKTEKNIRYVIERGQDVVSDWLFDNGGKIWEEVIIKHWW